MKKTTKVEGKTKLFFVVTVKKTDLFFFFFIGFFKGLLQEYPYGISKVWIFKEIRASLPMEFDGEEGDRGQNPTIMERDSDSIKDTISEEPSWFSPKK